MDAYIREGGSNILSLKKEEAASSSIRWFELNSLGSLCRLNLISKMKGKGNNTPAIGIHATPTRKILPEFSF